MIATVAPTIAEVHHSLNTFKYACSLNPQLPQAAVAPKSTPMAWSVEKLASFLLKQSDGRVHLDELLGDGWASSDFQLPPWKDIYELSAEQWVSACKGIRESDVKCMSN
jgi:hypothetical protein